MRRLQHWCHHDDSWSAAVTAARTSAQGAELLARPPLLLASASPRFGGGRGWGQSDQRPRRPRPAWPGRFSSARPNPGAAANFNSHLQDLGSAHQPSPTRVPRDPPEAPGLLGQGGPLRPGSLQQKRLARVALASESQASEKRWDADGIKKRTRQLLPVLGEPRQHLQPRASPPLLPLRARRRWRTRGKRIGLWRPGSSAALRVRRATGRRRR